MIYEIYVKLTNGCNLKCEHCYNEIMMNHLPMTEETFVKVIDWINDFQKKHMNDLINITFHGGEPLLYDIDSIIKLIESVKGDITFGVTTNLVYNLTDNHIKLFKMMKPYNDKPMISTSWDYEIRFNDNQQEIWENNVKELLKNGIDVQPIVCVTNKLIENIKPNELYQYFSNLGIKRMNFERITNSGRAIENKLRPLNKDLDKWLFDAYKCKSLVIPLFEGLESSLHGSFLGCRERQCMKKVITINPNGSISACPNMANKCFGTLDKIDVSKRNELIKFEETIDLRCLMCEMYKYCNGDCCQLEWDESGCPGMISILRYLNELERM